MLEIWWRDWWDGNYLKGAVIERGCMDSFNKPFTVERRGKKYILLEGPMKLPRYTTDNLEDCKATANAIVGIYDDD